MKYEWESESHVAYESITKVTDTFFSMREDIEHNIQSTARFCQSVIKSLEVLATPLNSPFDDAFTRPRQKLKELEILCELSNGDVCSFPAMDRTCFTLEEFNADETMVKLSYMKISRDRNWKKQEEAWRCWTKVRSSLATYK